MESLQPARESKNQFMKRREFLKSSAAATSVGTLAAMLDAAAAEKKQEAPREF
jgi:hypothetical protein